MQPLPVGRLPRGKPLPVGRVARAIREPERSRSPPRPSPRVAPAVREAEGSPTGVAPAVREAEGSTTGVAPAAVRQPEGLPRHVARARHVACVQSKCLPVLDMSPVQYKSHLCVLLRQSLSLLRVLPW